MHEDVVCLGREVVLIARVTIAHRDDTFAALLEASELAGDLLQLAQTRARQPVEIEHDHFDALVVARGAEPVDDVAHERLLPGRTLRFGDRALERVAAQLIDQRALRRDDERRGIRNQHSLANHTDEQQQEQAEQEYQVQQAAQPIEAAPNPRHDSHRPRAIVPIHVSLPCEGAQRLSSINDNSGQKAMTMTATNETSRNGCVAQ